MLERFKSLSEVVFDLKSLRSRFIDYLSYIFVILLPLSFIINFPLFMRQETYSLIAVDLILWFFLLIRVFVPSLGYRLPSILWVAIIYPMAISFLITLGPLYARPAWVKIGRAHV